MATIKTAISIQEALFNRIDELARDLQIPRSHIFVRAVEDYVNREENKRLLERINQSCNDEPDDREQKRLRQTRSSHRRMVKGEW